MKSILLGGAAALLLTASLSVGAEAQSARNGDRPLTIKRHPGGPTRGHGVEVRDHGNEVIAYGGFSANGYGYGRISQGKAAHEAENEAVRARTEGVYGYGFDGLGGTGFGEDRNGSFSFDNPTYGNGYNSYTGYNGVPTAFAFGPGFANRHITDSDDQPDIPGPTPGELGYAGPSGGSNSDN